MPSCNSCNSCKSNSCCKKAAQFAKCACRNTQDIKITLQQIINQLNQLLSFECTPITSVPFVITRPGCYVVQNNLILNITGPAIDIQTSNVILDGKNFTITVPNGGIGVQANATATPGTPFENIVIKNLNVTAAIKDFTSNTNNRGFILGNIDHLILDTIHTSYTNRGISSQAIRNVWIRDSTFEFHFNPDLLTAAVFFAFGCFNITIENCKFNDNTASENGRGLFIQNTTNVPAALAPLLAESTNIRVEKCEFRNTGIFGFVFGPGASGNPTQFIDGLEILGSTSIVTNPAYTGWTILIVTEFPLQFGQAGITNLTIRDVNISNPNANDSYQPIQLIGVTGGLLENLNINSTSSGFNLDNVLGGLSSFNDALIHLGYAITQSFSGENVAVQVENVTIRNSVLSGGSTTTNHQVCGIYIEPFCKDILIDNVQISQTGSGQIAPPTAAAIKGVKSVKTTKRRRAFDFDTDVATVKQLQQEPVIPTQRAAGILVDGSTEVIIKDSVIQSAQPSTLPVGGLPGDGVVFSGPLAFFPTGPGEPRIFPASSTCKIENSIISGNAGIGIGVNGVANAVESNNVKNNGGNGIEITGNNNFIDANRVINNAGRGINNTGPNNSVTDTKAFNNLSGNYNGVAAVVNQGAPSLAGQNLQSD